MIAGTEIIDNGASLKIITDGGARLILKQHIHEISVLRSSVLKLDVGNPLQNIYIEHSEVTNPRKNNAEELRDTLNEMLRDDCINQINQQVSQIAINVEAINSEIFIQASIVEQINTGETYYGYALPGAETSEPVWAIQQASEDKGVRTNKWADGNKNFDNVWDDRENLQYS